MNSILELYKKAFSNLNRNVWILSVAMFINRSGSMVLLFTSLYLTRDLHFTMAQSGMVMSCYGAGSIVGSYTGGWLTDRRNYYEVMLLSMISCGLVLLLMLVVSSLWVIAAVIFFYALCSDMFRPANSTAITNYTNTEDRTQSVSLMRLAINLGFSVGPAIGGFVAYHFGYKWLFAIDASTSFLTALMLILYLPKKKTDLLQKDNESVKTKTTSAYRDWKYLFFILMVAAYGICFFQLFASVPQYFKQVCNYNEDTIGLLLALNGLLVVIIEMPLIAAVQNTKNVFNFIIAGTLCIPAAFLILICGPGIMAMSIFYTLIITFSEIFAMPFMMNYALSRPTKERQGQYAALYSISFGIAVMIAPSLGLGLANSIGFNHMYFVMMGLSLLVAIGFLFISKNQKTVLQSTKSQY